jgi:hypothetical protein
MVIYMPQYNKRSKSYEFLNISQAVVSLCWQTGTTWENSIFDHRDIIISENLQYKLLVNFLKFPIITHTLKSNKQRRSYNRWNTVHKWKNLEYRFWFGLTMISQNSADWIRCRIMRNVQCKSDREIWYLSIKHKCALIRPTVQELQSLQVKRGVSSGQTAASWAIWTLDQMQNET